MFRAVRALLVAGFVLLWTEGAAGADILRYTVRYDPFAVELTLPDGTKQSRSLPRQPAYFSHRANLLWPIPQGPADQPIQCEIRWVGFPTDWRLVSNWNIDQRVESVETTLRGLRKAVFAGGDLRIARSKGGLVLVTRGQWSFPDQSLLDLMDRVAASQTAFWRYRGVVGHKIFLWPTTHTWEGEGRTNALILEGNPDTYDHGYFSRLLSHELFHEWNPRRLHYTDDEELYWFTEGFTDYYAVATLWRAGVWNFDQVMQDFNQMARRYYTSPARTLTAERMVSVRQSNVSANGLPYLQGYLLATHWNRSGTSLDQAMQGLLRGNHSPLSNARIAAALRTVVVESAGDEIQRFIVEGKPIELRGQLWGTCAAENKTEFRGFEMGFDFTPSDRTKIIQGIKSGSNAWQAGVRDGQKWTALDVALGDPTYLAEIEIEDEQGKRRVKYYPATPEAVLAPQFKAAARRCDPNTLTPLSEAR